MGGGNCYRMSFQDYKDDYWSLIELSLYAYSVSEAVGVIIVISLDLCSGITYNHCSSDLDFFLIILEMFT